LETFDKHYKDYTTFINKLRFLKWLRWCIRDVKAKIYNKKESMGMYMWGGLKIWIKKYWKY